MSLMGRSRHREFTQTPTIVYFRLIGTKIVRCRKLNSVLNAWHPELPLIASFWAWFEVAK